MAVQTQPVAKMVLFSSVLTPGSTTTFGTMNALATEMTFSNISMKNILGNLYDQYETFNISLNSVTIPQSAVTYGAVGSNLNNIMLFMDGLAFKASNTYSNLTRTSQTLAMVANFQLPTWVVNGTGDILYFNGTFVNTFSKYEEYIDITLSLRSPTGAVQVPAGPYPLMVYNFTIVGAVKLETPEYPHKSNELLTMASRMDGHNGPLGPPSNAQRSYNQSKFYLNTK